jgi:3-oxoacyl-(acyl-carrier-protein) synthase III
MSCPTLPNAIPRRPSNGTASGVGILGTGSCLPGRVVTNHEIGRTAQVDEEWILRKTGITERRWIQPGQATSDLATTAAQQALDGAGIHASELTVIIVATSTPDYPLPPTACLVQRELADCHAIAFDINAVCSGFVYALASGQSLLNSIGGHALIIGADTYSTILNPADRRTLPLFGDGAGAVILGTATQDTPTLTRFALFTDGSQADLIKVPAGGSHQPYSPEAHQQDLNYFTMDGRRVRTFVTEQVPRKIKQFLHDCQTPPDHIDHFIPHQANKVMTDELFPALGLPFATLHETAPRCGNTASASVPLTLDMALRDGKIAAGETILLAAFGGGMSIGLALIQ